MAAKVKKAAVKKAAKVKKGAKATRTAPKKAAAKGGRTPAKGKVETLRSGGGADDVTGHLLLGLRRRSFLEK